jgi:hypothetical protein
LEVLVLGNVFDVLVFGFTPFKKTIQKQKSNCTQIIKSELSKGTAIGTYYLSCTHVETHVA